MRVIAGIYKGQQLRALPGRATRPTTDRVREAWASSLMALRGAGFAGASVLDAFAGSGALGLEALSRGATRVLFADKNPGAVQVIRQNLTKLGLAEALNLSKAAPDPDRSAAPEPSLPAAPEPSLPAAPQPSLPAALQSDSAVLQSSPTTALGSAIPALSQPTGPLATPQPNPTAMPRIQLLTLDVLAANPQSLAGPAPYDMVFLDPPYRLPRPVVWSFLAGLAAAQLLADGCLVSYEHQNSSDPANGADRPERQPMANGWLVMVSCKAYGNTIVEYHRFLATARKPD
ncbi:MAG: RsmD family RNA methyltransferase [Actinomycetia bacterium]|nr:RsmD family RNA methyltransferase [Actinomycetes bacterium]